MELAALVWSLYRTLILGPGLAAGFLTHWDSTAATVGVSLVVWNVPALLAYGWDKRQAVLGRWRVSEKTLLAWAFLGPFGASVAMSVFRHKTRKWLFRLWVPTMAVAQTAALLWQ